MSITIPMWLLYVVGGIIAIVAILIFIVGLCFMVALCVEIKLKNMSISKAKLHLHGIINNLENCIEEGSYVTYQDIINQCKKVLKELEE